MPDSWPEPTRKRRPMKPVEDLKPNVQHYLNIKFKRPKGDEGELRAIWNKCVDETKPQIFYG